MTYKSKYQQQDNKNTFIINFSVTDYINIVFNLVDNSNQFGYIFKYATAITMHVSSIKDMSPPLSRQFVVVQQYGVVSIDTKREIQSDTLSNVMGNSELLKTSIVLCFFVLLN